MDLNKIVRCDYPNPLDTKLGLDAMNVWRDPNFLFKGMFRQTGWLMAAHDGAQRIVKTSVRWMGTPEIQTSWPELTGIFDGRTTLWSPEAGWVSSNIDGRGLSIN